MSLHTFLIVLACIEALVAILHLALLGIVKFPFARAPLTAGVSAWTVVTRTLLALAFFYYACQVVA